MTEVEKYLKIEGGGDVPENGEMGRSLKVAKVG
jgi:hypothetical protein